MIGSMNLRTRLLLYISGVVVVFCIIVGASGFLMAKNELDEKGETVLKNAVKMALMLIEEKDLEVRSGHISLAEAQERVKVQLMGELRADGTRPIENKMDLGENGYFIIYALNGDELMHPTLEGQNVWDVTDKGDGHFHLVQDQIAKAKQGGGYTEYTWNFPYSEKLGKKVAYAELDPYWNWVVTASAYKTDFNKGAERILYVVLAACSLLIYFTAYVSLRFVTHITAPIKELQERMQLTEQGQYTLIEGADRPDEIGDLVNGYNSMARAIRNTLLELHHEEARTRHLAYYDSLSGLPNRNLFKSTVSTRMNDTDGEAFLFLMDVKDFKLIISTVGSEYGDRIIALMGEVLVGQKLPEGHLARTTADEFGGWVEGWSIAELEAFVEVVRERISEAMGRRRMFRRFDLNVSYASYTKGSDDFESIYRKAAIAMNYAKQRSNGHLTVYGDTMAQSLEKTARLRELLELAVRDDDFRVFYQEKVACDTDTVQGVEALVRWESSELGPVSPAQFIPELDRANLTVPFGRLILHKVLADYRRLRQIYGDSITVSINISPLFFMDEGFTEFVLTAVSEYDVPPEAVYLEITEDVFINDFEVVGPRIEALRSHGLKVSMDDFGTGYSSLNYIQRIAPDELKIDRSLVIQLETDPRVHTIFQAVMQIAKTYHLSVVAEGVETDTQLQAVLATGCRIIQGYFFSRPQPLEALGERKRAGQ